MSDDRAKTPRTLLVADHLWETFSIMAVEMGTQREALVNQALYTFARLNGFLVPGDTFASKKRASPSPVQVDKSLLAEESQAATNMELPDLAASSGLRQPPAAEDASGNSVPPPPGEGAADAASRTLVLFAEGRELDRVIKDRFVIGRGKHCDLIINSGKVSREHAAITREGPSYFIEDLGSSNGTWFDKRRIGRRQIQDGDEYFICSEKLSCTFR
jgi:hypothetical protein